MSSITPEKNNKEMVPFLHYLDLYRKLDPKETAKRCNVPYIEEQKCFQLEMMGSKYLISFPEFEIKPLDQAPYLPLMEDMAAKILAIRYLIEGKFFESTGKFTTYREVPWGEVYFQNFLGRCIKRLAYGFGYKTKEFAKAMEKVGGKLIPEGDVGYEFSFMEGLAMRFILWESDEEFPPSSQILFGDNFSLAFTAEDMAVVGDVSITTIKKML